MEAGGGGGGGGEVIALALSWLVTTALTFLVVIVDERRLSEEELERAWPPSSRDAAIVAFGPLALLAHFVRTRGHLKSARGIVGFPLGLLMGLVAIALVAFGSTLVLEAVALLLDLPTP